MSRPNEASVRACEVAISRAMSTPIRPEESFVFSTAHMRAIWQEAEDRGRASRDADHCKDCCCARSWKALGDPEYDGRGIEEHITTAITAAEERGRQAATARAVGVLDVQVRDDGVWLHFKASTGKSALLCVESLAEGKRGIIGMALREWCADRHVAIKALGGGDE